MYQLYQYGSEYTIDTIEKQYHGWLKPQSSRESSQRNQTMKLHKYIIDDIHYFPSQSDQFNDLVATYNIQSKHI